MRTTSAIGISMFLTIGVLAQSGSGQPYTVAYASFGPLIAPSTSPTRRSHYRGSWWLCDMNRRSRRWPLDLFTSGNGSADIYRGKPGGAGTPLPDELRSRSAVLSPYWRTVHSCVAHGRPIVVLDFASRRFATDKPPGATIVSWRRTGSGTRSVERESAVPCLPPTSTTIFSPRSRSLSRESRGRDATLRTATARLAVSMSPDAATRVIRGHPVEWRAMGTDFICGAMASRRSSAWTWDGARQVLRRGPVQVPSNGPAATVATSRRLCENAAVRQRVNYVSSASIRDGRTAARLFPLQLVARTEGRCFLGPSRRLPP